MDRGRALGIGLVVAVLVITGAAALIALRPPSIPAAAASQPVGRAVLAGTVNPDPTEAPESTGDIEPGDQEAPSPAGAGCVPDISIGAAWAHLCWDGSRYLAELDPQKDYYLLRFHGSFQGLRWLVIRARLEGAPAPGAIFEGWPQSAFTGDCRKETVHVGPRTQPAEDEICGRTEGVSDQGTWTHSVTWTCEQCLVLDEDTRAISLHLFLGMPEGVVPSWDLFADAGT